MNITIAQLALLRAIQADPGGRLVDWANCLGVTTSSVWTTARRLARDGYLIKKKLGQKSSRFVMTGKAGTCHHCGRPIVPERVEADRNRRYRLPEESVALILASRASSAALARRFGVTQSWIVKLRKGAARCS